MTRADGAFEQGFEDGLKSAYPRLPVQLELVEDALAAFKEHLMSMEFHRLGIEAEMQLSRDRSSRLHTLREEQLVESPTGANRDARNDMELETVGAEGTCDPHTDDEPEAKALLSDWEQSALAAASVAQADYFSRPPIRNKELKSGRGPGPGVPSLYRRAVPKRLERTHPNSVKNPGNIDAPVVVPHETLADAQARNATQRSMGRYATYASRRVRTIRAVRKSETTSDQSSSCRHVRLSRKHNVHKTQPSKESYGERTDDTATHKLELVTCGSHYTNHHIKKLQHRKTAKKKLGRREYRSAWS